MSTITDTRVPRPSAPVRGGLLLRLLIVAAILAAWFWTQSLLGARSIPATSITDALQQWTTPLNSYFSANPRAADALLIVSSALVDALGLFLIGSWLAGGSVRPFLGLVVVMALRQIVQALCRLPAPAHLLWHNPGFPSLFVSYGVAGDFFFSGHTAIAVLGAAELLRFRRRSIRVVAIAVAAFEIAAVLVLRAHYTMDIFTAIIAALWVVQISARLAPAIDQFFSRRSAV
jgi:hypothetical protein